MRLPAGGGEARKGDKRWMFKQTVAAQGLFKAATSQAGINCGNPAACCWLPSAANATVRMKAKEVAGRESKKGWNQNRNMQGGGRGRHSSKREG